MMQIYYHDDCLAHLPGTGHPESPARLQVITQALRGSGLPLQWLAAPLGTVDQVLLAHESTLWNHVNARSPAAGLHSLDPDTHLSPGSLTAALRGVGAACAGIDALLAGQTTATFCLTRPPGHHATPDTAMGFCIFNHAAIAALYAQKFHGLQRVALVDFDVHHGNGSQDIVDGRPGLLYVSTHQFPHYPGTGSLQDNRPGHIHNLPLARGTSDTQYRQAFSSEILPILHAFRPELLIVSAGFDAHQQDPLGGLAFTDATYRWLGQQLKAVAAQHAQDRLLSVLEGGYNLQVLGGSVTAYCQGLLD